MSKPTDYAANVVAAKLHGLVGSPIEAVLGNALFARLNSFYESWTCCVWSADEYRSVAKAGCILAIVPQFQIENVGRVDFAVFVPALSAAIPLLVVECDGHDFHDRTHEQASRDRRRDRGLIALGIPALRFTGSDLLRNSAAAVDEISEILDKRANDIEALWWLEVGNELNAEHHAKPGAQAGIIVPYEWPRMRTDGKTGPAKK